MARFGKLGKYCVGYVYKSWVVKWVWNARRGCEVYTVSNPDRPTVTATFDRKWQAEKWIDSQR